MMKVTVVSVLFLCSAVLYSQDYSTPDVDTLRKDAINVYMGASSYLKTEIPFVNYVRDRKVADLVIIDTRQGTGSGGSEYTYYIEGQGRFAGMMDTLRYTASPDDTQEQRRIKEVNTLKMGLMRYIIKTPLAEYINIRFSEPISEEVSTDPWNNWVFRTRISGSLSGNSSNSSESMNSSFSASKVTSDWKVDFDLNYNWSKTEYDYGEIQTKRVRKSSSFDLLAVRSLSDHWSFGGFTELFNNNYSNYDLGFRLNPAIEYDIFPYSESTRRQFRILYSAGLNFNNYSDTTQFFKVEEILWTHSLQAAFEVVQQWGNVELATSWNNYLHDFSLNRFNVDGYINLRITKGLSISLNGRYSFIHNQVSLRKGDASIEDVLLNRQELSTTYQYSASIGLSYTFGSLYNNVVNPRFGGY